MIYANIDSTTGSILQIQHLPTRYKTEPTTTTDANGNPVTTYTQVIDDSLKPSWCTDEFHDDDAGAMKAVGDFQGWTYLNGTWSQYTPTDAEQLATAKNALTKVISDGYDADLAKGFESSADTTKRTYALIGMDATGMTPAQKWASILTLIASGVGQANYTIKDVAGNKVNLTQAQFKTMAADGFAYMNGLEAKRWTKENQRDACQTVADTQAIGWPNPNPPTVPTGLTATAGTAQATLAWTANTDVTMVDGGGYNVYQGGTMVNTSLVTTETYTATGLTTGTQYSFTITAVDTDGNESAQCTAVTVTPN